MDSLRRDRPVQLVLGLLTAAAVAFVVVSLRSPEVPTFAPSPLQADEVGEARVGPRTVTVDASHPERWRYFDFSRGTVVEDPGPLGWDLALRRFQLAVNGGPGFAGRGGALGLGPVDFDSLRVVPDEGYRVSESGADSVNTALERWYDYSWTSHVLTPRPDVYAVRTADGRYAKLQLVGYYCPGAVSGCLTFRYVYQGGGGTDVGG